MHGAGCVERGRSHSDNLATPLSPIGVAPPFASREALPYCAAPGAVRSSAQLLLNLQLNQRLTQARSAWELLRLHAEHGGSFNDFNLATCWRRLDRVECVQGFARQLEAFARADAAHVGQMGCSWVVQPGARARKAEGAWSILWEAVARASLRRMRGFTPHSLANTAWTCGTAGHSAPALLDAIAAEAALSLSLSLANTAWAYATATRRQRCLTPWRRRWRCVCAS